MSINVRDKGSNGEREAAKWLKKLLNLDYMPERNLEQTRSGGYDLFVSPFLVEVKRQEALNYKMWWLQITKASSLYEEVIPIVLFRQNRKKWRLLISAKNVGLDKGYVILDNLEAKEWLTQTYKKFIRWSCNDRDK